MPDVDEQRDSEILAIVCSIGEALAPHQHLKGQALGGLALAIAAELRLAKPTLDDLELAVRALPLVGWIRDRPDDSMEPGEFLAGSMRLELAGRLLAKLYPHRPRIHEAIWCSRERPDGGGPLGLTTEGPLEAAIIHAPAVYECLWNAAQGKIAERRVLVDAAFRELIGTQVHPVPGQALLALADDAIRAFARICALCDKMRSPPNDALNDPEPAEFAHGDTEPASIDRLRAALTDGNTPPAELATLIARVPGLADDVLQHVNCALFSPTERVSTLEGASARLGASGIQFVLEKRAAGGVSDHRGARSPAAPVAVR
ncbi:HDOD domain protein [Phycisphaerae bacterium RAS1]|nr:HDOD domain protein [Phycisphaerae bacterium RAS1]